MKKRILTFGKKLFTREITNEDVIGRFYSAHCSKLYRNSQPKCVESSELYMKLNSNDFLRHELDPDIITVPQETYYIFHSDLSLTHFSLVYGILLPSLFDRFIYTGNLQ